MKHLRDSTQKKRIMQEAIKNKYGFKDTFKITMGYIAAQMVVSLIGLVVIGGLFLAGVAIFGN